MQDAPHHGDRWFKDAVDQPERQERIESIVDALREQTTRMGTPLGETGNFPLGAMTPDDEGELRMAITAKAGKVIIAFGKATEWIGLSPQEARQMADALNEWAAKA